MGKSKKDQIIATATQLMFEKGIQATSMDEIAAGVPVAKMTIYKYFQSKNGLIGAVLQSYIQQLHKHLDAVIERSGTPLQALLELMTYREIQIPQQFLKECIENHPQYVDKMMRYYREHIAKKFEELIFKGQQHGMIRKDIAPHVLVLYLESMKDYLTRPEVVQNIHDFRTIGEQFQTILLYGIVAPEYQNASE